MLAIFIALLAAVGYLLYLYFERSLNYFKRNNVPHFPSNPFFGHFKDLMFLKRNPVVVLNEIYYHKNLENKPYGGIYIMQKPGLFIKDIELAKRILVTDANKFIDHYASTHRGDKAGNYFTFVTKGYEWKQLRKKMLQGYSISKVKNMFHLIDEVGQQLDKHLTALTIGSSTKSACKEIKPLTSLYTMDVIATIGFGINANTLNDPNAEFYKYGKDIFNFDFFRAIEFATIFFLPKLAPVIRTKFYGKKADKFLKDIYQFVMKERTESQIKRNDLIDVLLDLRKMNESEECDFKVTEDMMVSQPATFFSAGFETSSQTLTHLLYLLAKHPEIQDRLRKEIKDALDKNNGKVSFELINSIEYLDMVIKETLRLYPVIPFLDRTATLDSEDEEYSLEPFGNYKVKNGTPVFVPVYCIQRDPKYFTDPDKFDPERFSPANRGNILSGTFYPFGGGPRTCLGERIAGVMGKVGVIYFLKNHYFRMNEKTVKEIEFSKYSSVTLHADKEIFLEIYRDT